MTRVLFPDPFFITQNAAVRALGRRGYDCHVAWPYGRLKARFRSRYVSAVIPTTDRNVDIDGFAQDIVEICRSGDYDVVLPLSIESTEALVPHEPELLRFVSALLPTSRQLALGADKSLTEELCNQLEIPHPKSRTIAVDEDPAEIASAFDYPIVVKHPRNLGGSRGVRFAGDIDELRRACEELRSLGETPSPVIVQEFIPGFLFDADTVARDGECPAIFTSARKLMYPVSGGVACVCVSTRSPALTELTRRIMSTLKWNGPAELEFKLDPRDGRFKLIEINPRFWGSLGAAKACGIDFAGIAVDLALDRSVAPIEEYQYGVRHKFLIGRVPYAYWQMARARGWRSIRDPQRYARTSHDLDFRDPIPDIFRLLLVARDLLSGKWPKSLTDGARQMVQGLEDPVPYE